MEVGPEEEAGQGSCRALGVGRGAQTSSATGFPPSPTRYSMPAASPRLTSVRLPGLVESGSLRARSSRNSEEGALG